MGALQFARGRYQIPGSKLLSRQVAFRQSKLAFSTTTKSWRLEEFPEDPRKRASHAFSALAKSDKSWQRFRHMIDLAIEHQDFDGSTIRTVTDVGTDHGLLAVGLAVTGCFDMVLGVDVSPNALKNGGFYILERIHQNLPSNLHAQRVDGAPVGFEAHTSTPYTLPLDFRLSDGLQTIERSEADVVCIAGMGVNVMGKILRASSDNILELDRIQCRQLILQPTNSRPRNLVQLYDTLEESGWTLLDERIEYLSNRWYLSSCFVRLNIMNQGTVNLPTSKLVLLDESDPMKLVTRDYWQHHLTWIKREDMLSGGNLYEEDVRWREWVLKHI